MPNSKNAENFGALLRKLRGARSQADFGRFLGLPQQAIQRYERGSFPRDSALAQIADRLGTSVDALLAGRAELFDQNTSEPPLSKLDAQLQRAKDDDLLATLAARVKDATSKDMLVRQTSLMACQRLVEELLRRC